MFLHVDVYADLCRYVSLVLASKYSYACVVCGMYSVYAVQEQCFFLLVEVVHCLSLLILFCALACLFVALVV